METININSYTINIIEPKGKGDVLIRIIDNDNEQMYVGTAQYHPCLLDKLRANEDVTIKKEWDAISIVINMTNGQVYVCTLLLHTNTIYNADNIFLTIDNKILSDRITQLEYSKQLLTQRLNQIENRMLIQEINNVRKILDKNNY